MQNWKRREDIREIENESPLKTNQEEKIMKKHSTTKDPLLSVRFSQGLSVQRKNPENYSSELGTLVD